MPSLIGNKPNQVPSNGDLGTMAFRDQDQFYPTTQTMGFKNRIINGAMMIDQRNAGASVSTTPTDAIYTLDRWMAAFSTATRYTVQQNAGSVTPPTGFTNYLGCTSTASTSVGSSDYYFLQQIIEGFNVADLGWGTANAQTVTLSFWVRSSLTGTFGGALSNGGQTRSYPFTYTISSANTWEQKSITIAGDTTGTWLTTNGAGLRLRFGLGVGSTGSGTAGAWSGSSFQSATGATSVVGTNGATFYITGVQLEKGSTATSFDYRPYGTELQLCQRYFWNNLANQSGGYQDTSLVVIYVRNPVPMRTAPTVTAAALTLDVVNLGAPTIATPSISNTGTTGYRITGTSSSSSSVGVQVGIAPNSNALASSAEL